MYPWEAQQPDNSMVSHESLRLWKCGFAGLIPNTEPITARHGFACGAFGLRTRSFGRGGSFGAATDVAVFAEFFPTTMTMMASLHGLQNHPSDILRSRP